MKFYRSGLIVLLAVASLATVVERAYASVSLTGVANPKYLIFDPDLELSGDGVLKMVLENKTPGTNVSLCAGNSTDFSEGKCAIRLASSKGTGNPTLAIINAKALAGRMLYAIRESGTGPSTFVLTIE